MTVAVNDTIERYLIAGVGPYAYTWRIFNDTDLAVVALSTASPPVVVPLSYLTHYTVLGANASAGGSITLTAAAAAAYAGYTIDIRANTPENQPTSIRNIARFLPEIHEDAYDYLTRQIQDLSRRVDRTVRFSDDTLSSGEMTPIQSWLSKYLTISATGALVPALLSSTVMTGASIGALLNPQAQWESNQGVTITDFSKGLVEVDVQRYGILPNNIAFATANTAALKALLNPLIAAGFQGKLIFPPLIGGDTYHFNDNIQVRDKTHMDLQGCRLLFTKAAAAADQFMGCFTFIRDVTIENGSIEANITGTVGSNALPLLRIGSRSGYKFGSFTTGIIEKDDLIDAGLQPMGNNTVRKVYFKTNNLIGNCTAMVVQISGLRNDYFDNCSFEGNGATGPDTGIYYEMGDGSKNGFPATPAKWSTSSAINLRYKDIRGKNLNLTTGGGAVISITEAASFVMDGVYGDSVRGIVESRVGEGHFRVWNPTAGPRIGKIRGITGNCTGVGISVQGAQGTTTGQFSDAAMIAAGLPVLTNTEKVDLISYLIEGFDILSSNGTGLALNAPCIVRSGSVRGASNTILIQGECPVAVLDSVWSYSATSTGIRADTLSTLFARNKILRITNCKVVRGAAQAISLNYIDSAYVGFNQLGADVGYDNANETTQGIGVAAAANCLGVICEGNYVRTSGGAVAYNLGSIAGADESGGSGIVSMLGPTQTYAGKWRGVVQTANLTITAATPGNLAVAYSNQAMGYIREIVGSRVNYSFNIQTSSFTHTTAAGQFLINGLPYTVSAASYARNPAALSFSGLTKAGYTQFTIEPSQGANQFIGVACGTGIAGAALNITDFPTGGSVALRAAGHYFV